MCCILVTGASGYIGSVLVPLVPEKSYRVQAVDRFFFGQDRLAEHDRLEIIQDDTRKLAPDYFDRISAVIDLAVQFNDPSSEAFEYETWQINRIARETSPVNPLNTYVTANPEAEKYGGTLDIGEGK